MGDEARDLIGDTHIAATKTYTVLCRSRASALFHPGEELTVNYEQPNSGSAQITFSTRFEDRGLELAAPTAFVAESTGSAPDLATAAEHFVNGSRGLAAIVTVSANAWIGELELDLAYDSTPGLRDREFFQNYLPDEPLSVIPGRRVNIPVSAALIEAIGQHKDKDRLLRAVGQYSQTLQHWSFGMETLALSHLFMGMEALKPVVVRWHCQRAGVTVEELGAQWGFRERDGTMSLKG